MSKVTNQNSKLRLVRSVPLPVRPSSLDSSSLTSFRSNRFSHYASPGRRRRCRPAVAVQVAGREVFDRHAARIDDLPRPLAGGGILRDRKCARRTLNVSFRLSRTPMTSSSSSSPSRFTHATACPHFSSSSRTSASRATRQLSVASARPACRRRPDAPCHGSIVAM